MTTKKVKSSSRKRPSRSGIDWREVFDGLVGAVAKHFMKPEGERTFTISAKLGSESLGELQLPITEAANWSVDALAKFPTASRFEVSGRNGYSHETFDVKNGRVYEVQTLDDARHDVFSESRRERRERGRVDV